MSFDHAKAYLARVLPWPQEGDEPTYVGIHWSLSKLDKRGKPIWTGRAVRSVADAIGALEFAKKGSDTRDIYVCMATQRSANERVSKKGYKYLTPIRLQDNAVALKALFLDIDVKGGDKGYASASDAVAALADFVTKSSMPRPSIVVSSGGGLHVYWTLAAPLPPHEWLPYAHALAEATKHHGLRCDTQCTVDSVRVLRIPDTFNHKTIPPRPVRIVGTPTDFDYALQRIEQALAPFKTLKVAAPALPPRPALSGVSDLAAGVDLSHSEIDLRSVARECAFIRDAIVTNGANYTNPLWNLTTLVATFGQHGRAMAHIMSSGHVGYTKESTDELFDRKTAEREARNLGWPSCKTISASGCTACQTCKHFVENKSPLNFGARSIVTQQGNNISTVGAPPLQPNTTSPTPNTDLPVGYRRLPSNIICRILIDQDGRQSDDPISTYPMTSPWMQTNPWTLNFSTITQAGVPSQVALPLVDVATKDGLRRALWRQGLPLREGESKTAMEFFVSWIEKLQKSKDAVINSAPFGWSVHNGKIEGFIYGGRMWMPGGDRLSSNQDPVIGSQYEPTGEIAPWLAAAAMITSQGRPQLDAILAASFGAPLVRFTGQSGLLMSTYSVESGVGKSTAMKVAQAVWGDPIRGMQGLSDTVNSVINKIGELRALPLYWDELKTEDDTRKFVNLAFQLSLGKEKSRLTQSASQRAVGTWQTILVSASNESLMDFVVSRTKMTTAGLYRVFEYEVSPGVDGQINPSDASQIIAKLDDNYGTVGLKYAQFIGANHARVGKEVAAYHKALSVEIKSQNDERFWTSLVACVCMGARYSNELGFTKIDEKALRTFMIGVLNKMRREREKQPVDMKKVMNVSNILAQFLNAMRARHTITTNRIHVGRGRPTPGSIKIVSDVSKLDGVYVHIGKDDKMLRISSTFFTSWMAEQGYSRHLFMRAIESDMGAKIINGRMSAGTALAGVTEYIIEVSLAGSPLIDFIDEA